MSELMDLADVADELDVDLDDDEELDLRGLVMSEGRPYILIVVEDPATGGVKLTTGGLDPEIDLALALQEIALLIADAE